MHRSLKSILLFLLQLQFFAVVKANFKEKHEASLRPQNGKITFPSKYQPSITATSVERESTLISKIWPPWPFDRLGKRGRLPTEALSGSKGNLNTPMLWEAFMKRATVSVRQCREICASLYCHLPPALPPVILLASIPKQVVNNGMLDVEVASRKIVPLISVPFIRNLALGGFVITLISWGDAELHRKRQLTPLLQHRSVSKASITLPSFLPEEISDQYGEGITNPKSFGDKVEYEQAPPKKLRRVKIAKFTERLESFYTNWKRSREHRKINALNARRESIYKELVALQSSKEQDGKVRTKSADTSFKIRGFALVTGASTGIGRALATELARWGVSLILVARNQKKLMSLADDLEACYGVRCHVLPADLSVTDAAESIHRTTTKNDLTVDILVNNAGVATSGLAIGTSMSEIESLLFVNTLSSAKLTSLYGNDMAKRRRGRILMVSSMAGLASSVPNAAVYGATKAFLRSLSLSTAKELETFGIGVTTLMPGAVKTNFRHNSGMENSLCWHLPFYSRPVESVAKLAVTSLLDGDTEVVPGLLNRLFAKVVRPLLPRRLEAICIEAAFKPLPFPHSLFHGQFSPIEEKPVVDGTRSADRKSRFLSTPHSAPKLLQLESQNEMQDEDIDENNDSKTSLGNDLVRKNIAIGEKAPDDADTVPEHTEKDKDMELEVKDETETQKRKLNHNDLLPKRSGHKPNLLLQESLLQTEKVQLQ